MHLRPVETDNQTLTAREQTPPTPMQRTMQTNQTTSPDLADGDAHRKSTQRYDWVPDGNWSGDTDMGLGPKNGGSGKLWLVPHQQRDDGRRKREWGAGSG